ncbi:DUF6483 family protein [Paenibacillus lutrae]|uniref:Tetratricopeptide repeat protein n=1 Tax=Paenibacillus lutrae TaxID=2078573 RepID=A0A7X3K0H5_9BACL|nr:DUF6483 family protein [Paenibacillus lutrae]MVP01087.1 hypothetical protein [Paenibacillus lutrae]
MFERKDYLITMISRMIEAIASRVAKLRRENKHEEALEALGELYGKFYLPPAKVLGSVQEEDAFRMLRTGPALNNEKLVAAARLLREEGEIYEDMGQEREAYQRRVNALFLYYHAAEQGADTKDIPVHEEIKALQNRLKAYRLSPAAHFKQMEYFANRGRFDEAENILYELGREISDDRQLPEWGLHFYERLLHLSDQELEDGGLPRSEVELGLQEWKSAWPRLEQSAT